MPNVATLSSTTLVWISIALLAISLFAANVHAKELNHVKQEILEATTATTTTTTTTFSRTKVIGDFDYDDVIIRPLEAEIPDHRISQWDASQFIVDARTYYRAKVANGNPQAPGTLTGYTAWLDELAKYFRPLPVRRKGELVVVGAGPVGLTAALLAVRSGYSVRLSENRCSYTRQHIVNTHKKSSFMDLTNKVFNANSPSPNTAFGMSHVLENLGLTKVIGTVQAHGKLFEFFDPIDNVSPIDYKVMVSDLEYLLLATFLIARDDASTFEAPTCAGDKAFLTVLKENYKAWADYSNGCEARRCDWRARGDAAEEREDAPLVKESLLTNGPLAILHAEGARSPAHKGIKDGSVKACAGMGRTAKVTDKGAVIADYWSQNGRVAPITFEFVFYTEQANDCGALNQNTWVARTFSKYHQRRKLCLFEVHLKREFGVELIKTFKSGFRWPRLKSASYGELDVARQMGLLHRLIEGLGRAVSKPVEAKIWQSFYGMPTRDSDKTPVIAGSNSNLYHFLIGDAARSAYPNFAMGVNDGACLAKAVVEKLSQGPATKDACKNFDTDLRNVELEIVSNILDDVADGAPLANAQVGHGVVICPHLVFANNATTNNILTIVYTP